MKISCKEFHYGVKKKLQADWQVVASGSSGLVGIYNGAQVAVSLFSAKIKKNAVAIETLE